MWHFIVFILYQKKSFFYYRFTDSPIKKKLFLRSTPFVPLAISSLMRTITHIVKLQIQVLHKNCVYIRQKCDVLIVRFVVS